MAHTVRVAARTLASASMYQAGQQGEHAGRARLQLGQKAQHLAAAATRRCHWREVSRLPRQMRSGYVEELHDLRSPSARFRQEHHNARGQVHRFRLSAVAVRVCALAGEP
eukprot:CAMPEP_0177632552 /NCGR_PEP_ID=MMETSP0447-20121125/2362_1 /TAXON_ID=0 /ORGANISM="Stygamoeba regulata, Strain BSH-02190019" /LENGTH=109 /DNA_ID=CAMNT_0019134147 /DNA_START=257 /DNA_END=584 /DNA_ORIENTATION=+